MSAPVMKVKTTGYSWNDNSWSDSVSTGGKALLRHGTWKNPTTAAVDESF